MIAIARATAIATATATARAMVTVAAGDGIRATQLLLAIVSLVAIAMTTAEDVVLPWMRTTT